MTVASGKGKWPPQQHRLPHPTEEDEGSTEESNIRTRSSESEICLVFLRLAAAAGGDLAIDFTSIQNKMGRYTNKAAPQRKRSQHCLCAFSVTLQIWYLPFVLHQRIACPLSRTCNPETAYLHGIPYSQMGGQSASSIIQLLRKALSPRGNSHS